MHKKKKPMQITATRLSSYTMWYLERYSSSVANLRRLLYRRVDLAISEYGGSKSELRALVDSEVDRLIRIGLLSDKAFANARAQTMFRRGRAKREISMKLRTKGISPEIIADALSSLPDDADWIAAIRFAKKRRLGPFSRPDRKLDKSDFDGRRKMMAKFARAGFSFEFARRILDHEDHETLEAQLD